MRTMESSMRLYALLCAALLPVMMCLSCNKLISDLIPPDEQKLISLDLRNVERYVCSTNTAIRDHSVTVTVPKGTDVTRLLPEAVVSAQATLFPVTLRYLQEAFPATDILKIGSAIGSFENIEAINKWFFEMYAENPNFTIPELIFPINFLSPVPFAVIGGQGRIELYTVKVLYDDGTDPATGTLPEGVPAEKNILSFSVGEPQIGESVIGAKTVDFEVKAGTEVRALTVQATVSPHAVLIPLTEPYLVPLLRNLGMDPLSVLSGYITAPNKEAYLRALFAPVNLSSVTVPLNKPIDFTNSVQFAVLGNDKDVKLYTARCKQTVTGAVLKNFGFSKVKNPALVKDGTVRIDRAAKTVTAELFYPVEYTGSGAFSLYCDVAYAGDAALIEYKGTRYNAADNIPFTPENPSGAQYHLGTAETKIIITFGTEQTEYRLFISFKEDPDTVRSITDFRFTKDKNSELKTLSMAAIANDGHEGTITATVLYTGSAKPESLIPTFITPGTVTVNGAVQTSGSSAQDFRRTLAYICTSRDGQYTRKYTVKIRFVYAEPAQSLLKTFRFPAGVNPLTKDSEGRIDQTAHTVHITAHYAGEKPKKLIPEFSATGEVTVDALTQSSGFSAQDFEYPVYYKVTDPGDPSTYTIYAVTVHFEYSADSGCELTEFKLLMQDNPSLTQDVTAFISAHSGVIYALLPRGADAANLIPRFTARGRVTVDGVEQTSGETATDFSEPVEYKVTSENGLHTKTYRVTLQQAGGIIYVDPKATGRNNGSTWEDAFTNLEAAIQKANEMPTEVSAEIWLSKDFKSPEGKRYELKRTLTLRGGFNGVETEADQRNKDNKSVFDTVNFSSSTPIRGTLTFDGIEFADHPWWDYFIIKGIQWDTAAENNALVIQNCKIVHHDRHGKNKNDFQTSVRLASVTLKDTEAHDAEYGSGELILPECDTAVIDNFNFEGWRPKLAFWTFSSGQQPLQKVVITNSRCRFRIDAKDITVSNSSLNADTGFRAFDRILLDGVTGRSPRLDAALSASISIKNCKIKDTLTISAYGSSDDRIPKLKNVSIEKSAIDIVTAYAITEKLYLYDIPGWDNKSSFKGCWINVPACSVEIRHCDFGAGGVFTACRGKIFKDIMEAVPVHTDILGVKADYIYCGYVQYTGSGLGFDGFYATEDLRNTAAEYRLPPYSLKLGEDWAKIYRELYGEPVPFKSGGSHLLKDLDVKELYVFSGDSITLEKENEYRGRLNGILLGPLTFYYEYSSANNINYLKHKPECSSVVLNNETTPNSTIDIDGIRIQGEWLRAITNNLSMRNIEKAYPTGCMELYGYDRVSVDSCDFSNLSPFYDDRKDSPSGRIRIRPSFIAAGRTVNVTNCTFDPLFFDVRSGTCFDGQRNSTFNCTAAVWKK